MVLLADAPRGLAPSERGTHASIFYRANGDAQADRRNIRVLQTIVTKATTPVSAEIFYHLPRRLSDWTDPGNGVRYTRLRNDSEWPLAERIARLGNATVLVFDGSLLLSASDVWHLLGYARQHERVLLQARRAVHAPHESCPAFALREARLHLQHRVWERTTDATAMALRVNGQNQRSVRALASYTELLRATAHGDFFAFYGNSRAIGTRTPYRWLASLGRTTRAVQIWRNEGRFARSYSEKTLLFHIAQIAAYTAAIFAFVAPTAAAIIMGFAICITPTFFLGNINPLRPGETIRRLLARFALYFIG